MSSLFEMVNDFLDWLILENEGLFLSLILIGFVLFIIWVTKVVFRIWFRHTSEGQEYYTLRFSPKPRREGTKLWHMVFTGLCSWRSPLYNYRYLTQRILGRPPSESEQHPAYLGNNLLSCDNERAILHSGCRYYFRRMFWLLFIFGPIFLGFVFHFIVRWADGHMPEWITNDPSRQYECIQVVKGENDYDILSSKIGNSLIAMIRNDFCNLNFILDSIEVDGSWNKITSKQDYLLHFFIKGGGIAYLFCLFYLLTTLFFMLRPAPAPLVFDRQRKLVYTRKGGKIYMGHYDALCVTLVQLPDMVSSIGVRLYTKSAKGEWVDRWFTLRRHSGMFEKRKQANLQAPKGIPVPAAEQLAWLLRYRYLGVDAVYNHPVKHISWHKLFVWFTQRLPDNITEQVQAMIGDDLCPQDRDFIRWEEDIRRDLALLLKRDLDQPWNKPFLTLV